MHEPPPDVLLITTDQHRHDLLGFAGCDLVATPNLDALAARGVRMRQARTPIPLCMPARACLMTGRSPDALGLTDNRLGVDAGDDHVFARLAAAGARTAVFGKNHAFTPAALAAFDAVEVHEMHGKDATLSRTPPGPEELGVTAWRKEAIPYFEAAVDEPQPGGEAADPAVRQTDEAVAFLRSHAAEHADRSFGVYLSFEAPHFPYVLPEPRFSATDPDAMPGPRDTLDPDAVRPARLRAQWHGIGRDVMTDADVRRVQATYLGMVELVDAQVGRVLAELERSGRLDRTLVLFTSDHGDFWGNRGLVGKSTLLDESLLRVPMVLAGPGVGAGASDALVSLEDAAPTLLALAGLPPLAAADGRSFAGVLRGGAATHRSHHRATHAFGRERGWTTPEIRAAVAGRDAARAAGDAFWFLDALRGRTRSVHEAATGWKLVTHDAPDEPDQLFDLRADPRELRDLAADPARAATLVRLRAALIRPA